MYQRDYLLKLIEEAGRVLSRLTGLRSERKLPEAMQYLEEGFQEVFRIHWDAVRHSEPEALGPFLDGQGFGPDMVEVVAALLQEAAWMSYEAADWAACKHYALQGRALHAYLYAGDPAFYAMGRAERDQWFEDTLDQLNDNPPTG